MSAKKLYTASLFLGLLALILMLTNIALVRSNTRLQDQISQRQAEINKAGPAGQLNQGLVQALADAALNTNDAAIKDLLSSQGITLNKKPAAAATAADDKKTDKK